MINSLTATRRYAELQDDNASERTDSLEGTNGIDLRAAGALGATHNRVADLVGTSAHCLQCRIHVLETTPILGQELV